MTIDILIFPGVFNQLSESSPDLHLPSSLYSGRLSHTSAKNMMMQAEVHMAISLDSLVAESVPWSHSDTATA
jgi:hypothetical protein